jgi:hypothetical protein
MQQCSLFPSPIHRFHLSFHFLFSPPILYLHPPHRLGLRLHGVAPCGACKFLRPRCVLECVTIAYEAQARLRDPVYGCVAQTFTLQQHAKPPRRSSPTAASSRALELRRRSRHLGPALRAPRVAQQSPSARLDPQFLPVHVASCHELNC